MGPSGKPDTTIQFLKRKRLISSPGQQEGCPQHILQQRLQTPFQQLRQLDPRQNWKSRDPLSSGSASSTCCLGNVCALVLFNIWQPIATS